ncbi:hypothetical protein MVEN_01600800 [Mycena venus]|uniref:Uncharacterized protein n=1 Tax=Mycena venus TaxID=2733690 RepID=A0A8H6XST7_9AGAR|nr:hypothetical protein MVEN_01600800 [Mycena venus]
MDATFSGHHGPRLPRELECTIFEAAALSRPTSIPQLALVAWRVNHWVEPLLYQVLFVSRYSESYSSRGIHQKSGLPVSNAEILLGKIANKPAEFLRSSVKHLFLDVFKKSDVEAILMACICVTNLFIETSSTPDPRTLAGLQCLHHLTIDIETLFGGPDIDFSHPLFRNITHLELLDDYRQGLRMDVLCSGLALIPHLTHIAFNTIPKRPELGGLSVLHARLRADIRLQCILFLSPDVRDAMRARRVLSGDDRIVCIDQDAYRLDWIHGARTGEDYWTLAEAFIAAKRAGKVDRMLYNISDDDDSWRT